MSAHAAALSAHGVVRRFGEVTALSGVSLDIAAGQCVALVGESGSGKTTLLRCFNKMVVPDAGQVTIDGQDIATHDPVQLRRSIGYVPQDGGLMPHWRVQRNVELVPWLRGVAPGEAQRMAREALTLVGLAPEKFAHRWPHELSGGQRQRVAIARALATRPALLLLDEPLGALDAISRGDLQQALLDLQRELQVTMLLVTHDLHEAARLGDRIAVMRHGQLEQVANTEALLKAPGTPYVAELLRRAGLSGAHT
ncbi:MAG: ATP-binding cassette domain-containing protein [Gemmatimonadaceae bacterium]